MSKPLRLSEKWFRRGLWLVALVFASFLIGLGGTIVAICPRWKPRCNSMIFWTRPLPRRCACSSSRRTPPNKTPRPRWSRPSCSAAKRAAKPRPSAKPSATGWPPAA